MSTKSSLTPPRALELGTRAIPVICDQRYVRVEPELRAAILSVGVRVSRFIRHRKMIWSETLTFRLQQKMGTIGTLSHISEARRLLCLSISDLQG